MWMQSAETAEEIINVIKEENTSIDLIGDIKIRKTRFQGRSVLEVVPSTYEQIRELRETSLLNIIQNSRNRFFISEHETIGSNSLSQVLKMYPPLSSLKTQEKGVYEQNTSISNDISDSSPVELPGWLIEPTKDEVERISIRH